MNVNPHPYFLKAGKIAGRVLSDVEHMVQPGEKIIKICKFVEDKIIELGATCTAFPCLISIDNEVTKFTSPYNDLRTFPDKGLVKIDIGVNVNGHIADTAITVDIDGSYEHFIHASKDALEEGIIMMRPDVRLYDVGQKIERTIKKHGLKSMGLLSGHQIEKWKLHGEKPVPNIELTENQIEKLTNYLKNISLSPSISIGESYAVEPFVTDGNGKLIEGEHTYIYSNNLENLEILDISTERIWKMLVDTYKSLQWSSRWLHEKIGELSDEVIMTLLNAHKINEHPTIFSDGISAQFEHSLFIGEYETVVTTRRENEILSR